MTTINEYPATAAECIDDGMFFPAMVIQAVANLAKSKPWSGTLEERIGKLKTCAQELARAHDVAMPFLHVADGAIDCYRRGLKTICLNKRGDVGPSVITFLHEFGHHLGYNEREACRYSLNLFKRYFPKSFAKLQADRHCLRRRAG
jgi:hypothetical protein